MERAARQYHVLSDKTILQSYEEKHRTFQHTLGILLDSLHDSLITSQLRSLSVREMAQFDTINASSPRSTKADAAIAEFATLADLAQTILADSNKVIDREVDAPVQRTYLDDVIVAVLRHDPNRHHLFRDVHHIAQSSYQTNRSRHPPIG